MKYIDLEAQYKSIKYSLDKTLLNTAKGGKYILGKQVVKLEEKVAALIQTKYAVGLNSGTDALFLSLKAMAIGHGDEVITTPFSFVATAEVIATAGAKPVFVDINPRTFNIDPAKIKRAITKRSKVIMPVHLYGQMADMDAIIKIAKKHKLFVIEDAAQAIGATQKYQVSSSKYLVRKAGSAGNIGCFSFFPTKNLGAYGDGGMITTNYERLAEKIRMLRNHGSKKKYQHDFLGFSSRLDELQAAILLAKLPHLKKWNKARQKIAAYYTKNLAGIEALTTPFIEAGDEHIFHQYTIRTKERDKLRAFLSTRDIPTSIHYPLPLHLQPALKYLNYKLGDFPEAELAAKEVLSLPLYPELKISDQNKIINAVISFYRNQ
ncbi:MAG: DegT/DnrJ/EryC1/StrS family aminotransferase [bacterium]|nr:DegT/DnrJ/EryC1/StrS family aminotransferase [bacterium]